eukprot:scaffold6865_cov97-Isochrysis_galbana.AAC.5
MARLPTHRRRGLVTSSAAPGVVSAAKSALARGSTHGWERNLQRASHCDMPRSDRGESRKAESSSGTRYSSYRMAVSSRQSIDGLNPRLKTRFQTDSPWRTKMSLTSRVTPEDASSPASGARLIALDETLSREKMR